MSKRHSGMIVSDWNVTPFSHVGSGYCPQPDVDENRHDRVSALLGPDGKPLMVGYERPALGFDLRHRGARK